MINLKININENELRAAKELAIRLKTQDNRATALPIIFLLQDVEEFRSFDDCGGEYLLFGDESGCEFRGASEEEIIQKILEFRKQDIDEEDDSEDFKKKCSNLEDEIRDEVEAGTIYAINLKYITKRIFLTEQAANNHLKSNAHHYSDKARIYVDHCWRDPEMELVYKILTSFMYADIDPIPEPISKVEDILLRIQFKGIK